MYEHRLSSWVLPAAGAVAGLLIVVMLLSCIACRKPNARAADDFDNVVQDTTPAKRSAIVSPRPPIRSMSRGQSESPTTIDELVVATTHDAVEVQTGVPKSLVSDTKLISRVKTSPSYIDKAEPASAEQIGQDQATSEHTSSHSPSDSKDLSRKTGEPVNDDALEVPSTDTLNDVERGASKVRSVVAEINRRGLG